MLRTDASDTGLGSMLLQKYDDVYFPVAFASKRLSKAQMAYAVVEHECLAIVWSLQCLHCNGGKLLFINLRIYLTVVLIQRRFLLELFVFNVDCSTDENCIKEFLKEEQVKVIEMECVSHKEAWTKSFRVLVTADDPVCTLDCDFWPLGIGCRRFFKKRQRNDQ